MIYAGYGTFEDEDFIDPESGTCRICGTRAHMHSDERYEPIAGQLRISQTSLCFEKACPCTQAALFAHLGVESLLPNEMGFRIWEVLESLLATHHMCQVDDVLYLSQYLQKDFQEIGRMGVGEVLGAFLLEKICREYALTPAHLKLLSVAIHTGWATQQDPPQGGHEHD